METGLTTYRPQSAVEIRRQMAKNAAIIGTLAPVERSVFLASTDKLIGDYGDDELSAELTKALKWIAKDVGYRVTDESERVYLIIRVAEILKRYYSLLSLRDFKMAFEMSITGELDDYLPKGRDGQADRGHYQHFNAEYVCKILNAYKQRRATILRKAYESMPKEQEQALGKEEIDAIMARPKRDCIAAYVEYSTTGHLPEISPVAEMLYYQVLSDAGLAPEIEVTIDEQKAIFHRTMNEYARKGMIGDMNRLKNVGPGAPELQHGSFVLARRKALIAAFQRMKDKGVCITDYVKI